MSAVIQIPVRYHIATLLVLGGLAACGMANSVDKPVSQDHKFELLTEDRIDALPEKERAAWHEYLNQSLRLSSIEHHVLEDECRSSGRSDSVPAPGNSKEFEPDSDLPDDWFKTPESLELARTVLSYQTPTGGWSKAVDYSAGPRPKGTHWTSQKGKAWHYCGTLDNRSTTEQIKFLARVYSVTQREDAKQGTLRGLEWLLMAQYPTGGWPQNYPVESGYHEAITLNDNAMVHAMEVLLTVSEGHAPFEFVEDQLRQRALGALQRAYQCLAKMQVRVDGQSTVWCAQHDPISLVPVGARKKEPASLSGGESAELLKFLMRKGPTDAATVSIVETALAWLEAHRIHGIRKIRNAEGKTDYVPDENSTEVYWARFYDITSAKPMFAGADDGIVYSSYREMAAKNKVGYDYFSSKPGELLEKEVVRWKKRLGK